MLNALPGSLSPTVPMTLATELLTGLELDQEVIRKVIERANIAPELFQESGARISIEQFSRFYRQLAILLDDETPGFFSRPLRQGSLKFLCLGMFGSPNLDIALHRFRSYFRLVLDDMGFEVTRSGHLTRIALVEHVRPQGSRVLVHEIMLKLVHGVASWMIDRKIPLVQVDFAYHRPQRASEYVYLFPGPIHFDKTQTALYMDSEYLSAPIRKNMGAFSTFLRNAPADWLYVPFSEKMQTHRVRDYLETRLGEQPTLESTGRALHFSKRSLSRRLAEEGTTFQAIKDELRRDMAINQLLKSNLSVTDISLSIGIENQSVFNRAFKLWTGSTPGSYRRFGSLSKGTSVKQEPAEST
nr:AraC family transcriptional regulator [uncultured Rhodoferax sp.]